MKNLVSGLTLVFQRKDSRAVLIAVTLFVFLLIVSLENGKAAMQILSFDILPLPKRLSLFISTLFDITNTFTVGSLILTISGSIIGGINMALAYLYMLARGRVILHSGLYSGIGLALAFLGVGCAACGTALLSIVLSFFGLSTILNILPYKGLEVGYIGLMFLVFATYSLSQKVMNPNVC